MLDFSLIRKILWGPPRHPAVKNLRQVNDDGLYFDSLTRGLVISGNPGTGKTTWAAMQIIAYIIKYPSRPVFILDASGSLTNEVIELAFLLPPESRDRVIERLVLDIPGDEEYVVPQPFFSPDYGLTDEELIQRPVMVLKELNSAQVELTPIMSISLTELAPELFRLINVIRSKEGNKWQVTEARKLLIQLEQLRVACNAYGQYAPEAKFYLENEILGDDIGPAERQRRMLALRNALGVIETRPLRARYGSSRPTVTAKKVITEGLVYILSGEKLVNLEKAQAWVFWDAYSSLEAVINKRTPHDPHDPPVLLVIDEVYKLFEIEGMAKKLGQISTYYRSRKLMPIIILQAYWQLADILKEQIWSFGNQAAFALENFDDAYKYGQQVQQYNARQEKVGPSYPGGQPIMEPDRGQYLHMANWLQNLKWRQMVMRRYTDERNKEAFISFIAQTAEKPTGTLPAPLLDLKQELFKKWAVPVAEALKEINGRKLTGQRPTL